MGAVLTMPQSDRGRLLMVMLADAVGEAARMEIETPDGHIVSGVFNVTQHGRIYQLEAVETGEQFAIPPCAVYRFL